MSENILEKDEAERFSLSYISQVFDDACAFGLNGYYFKRAASATSKNNTKTIMETFLPESLYFDRCLGNGMWTDTFFRTKGKHEIDSKAVSVHNSNNRTVFCKAKFKTARGGNRGSGVKTLLKDIADQFADYVEKISYTDAEKSKSSATNAITEKTDDLAVSGLLTDHPASRLISAFAAKQRKNIEICLAHKSADELQSMLTQMIDFAISELSSESRSKLSSDIISLLADMKVRLGDTESALAAGSDYYVSGSLQTTDSDSYTSKTVSCSRSYIPALADTLTWLVILAVLTYECFGPCIDIYRKYAAGEFIFNIKPADTIVPSISEPAKAQTHIHKSEPVSTSSSDQIRRFASGTVSAPAFASSDIGYESLRQTEDYLYLINKYVDTAVSRKVTFENSDGTETVFPVTLDFDIAGKNIAVEDDPDSEYQRPSYLDFGTDAYKNIMETYPSVKNNPNIRVDDWYIDPDSPETFIMRTSRTHYYDSLLTNRSLDYQLDKHTTLRELLFCDNNVGSLKKSKLSNHLGFNGFLISSDGHVPFVRRGNDLSTETGKWGNSIQASLKTRYALTALDEKGREISCTEFDTAGLFRSITTEIRDEMLVDISTSACRNNNISSFTDMSDTLNIAADDCKTGSLHIIAAYRNLIEGGKPQLLFYAETSAAKPEIHSRFTSGSFDQDQRKVMDGQDLFWIPLVDLIDPAKIRLHINGFQYSPSGTFSVDTTDTASSPTSADVRSSLSDGFAIIDFSMAPSSVATLAMFIAHIRKHADDFPHLLK